MNSKAFVVLFFTVALIGAVHSTVSIDTNVYNGSLNVPLLVRYSSRFLCKLDMKPHTLRSLIQGEALIKGEAGIFLQI